jgi:hypothetical protein
MNSILDVEGCVRQAADQRDQYGFYHLVDPVCPPATPYITHHAQEQCIGNCSATFKAQWTNRYSGIDKNAAFDNYGVHFRPGEGTLGDQLRLRAPAGEGLRFRQHVPVRVR